jgi:hypothetical protein
MKVKRSRLWNRVNSQIFVWAGDEPKEIKFSGFRFKVPPRTETARADKDHPGSIYKFESARDSKGNLIPGTVLAQDVMSASPSGGVHRVFDVAACCEYLNRDVPELFNQGFAIVSDVNDIPLAMAEILPDYEATQDKKAHTILQGEMERQRKMEEKGQIVTERDNPEVVAWAMQHLARRGKTVRPSHGVDDIAAVLEGRYRGPVEPLKEVLPVPEVMEAPPSTDGRSLFQECEDWGVRLSKRELEAVITGDEEQIAFIRSKLKVKREAARVEASA